MRLEGPGTAALIVEDQATRRDRWSESAVVAEPRQVRASPIERAAVGEVPADATAQVTERKEQKDAGERAPQPKPTGQPLTADEQREVNRLADVDRRVKAREQAYMAASRGLARAATVRYVTGPDGRQYAVDANVQIDTTPIEGNPEQTLAKAEAAEAAALAAADPTPNDRLTAARARRMADEARQKLRAQRMRASLKHEDEDAEQTPGQASESAGRYDPRVSAYVRPDGPYPGRHLSFSA